MRPQVSAAAGLVTSPGEAFKVGALSRGMNLMVRRHGLYEQRRSYQQLDDFSTATVAAGWWGQSARIVSAWTYGSTLYVLTTHDSTTYCIWRYNPGGASFVQIGTGAVAGTGGYTYPPNVNTPPRSGWIRSSEAAGGLIFATGDGPYVMDSATATPRRTGVPRGREMTLTAATVPTGGTGVFTASGQTAVYRSCWFKVDANNNVIRGAPGGRTLFTASGTAWVTVKLWLTSETVAGDWYEVYRSDVLSAAASAVGVPDDELQLIYRSKVTSQDVSNGYVQFIDVQVDGTKGPKLYTNPSQGGIGLENARPPICADLITHKGATFYMDCKSPTYNGLIQMLAIPQRYVLSGTGGKVDKDTPVVGTTRYTFTSDPGNLYDFTGITAGMYLSVKGCTNAGNNGDFVITAVDTANRRIEVTNGGSTSEATPPAAAEAVACKLRVVTGATYDFHATYNAESATGTRRFTVATAGTTNAANIRDTAQSLVRVINQSGCGVIATDVSDPTRSYGLLLFEQPAGATTTAATLQAFGNGSTSGASGGTVFAAKFAPTLHTATSLVQDVARARVLISRQGQPECVPASTAIDVGDFSSPCLRAFSLRDSVFIFKTDGLYRIDGDGQVGNWRTLLFDPTIRLLSPNLVTVHQGAIYALTNRGVVRVTDAGREFLSSPIDDLVSSIVEQDSATDYAHAEASEIDGLVFFYLNYRTTSTLYRRIYLTYCPATGVWTGDADQTKVAAGLDTELLSYPGIPYKPAGAALWHLARFSIANATGTIFVEQSLTEDEPAVAKCWENKLPLPGDKQAVIVTVDGADPGGAYPSGSALAELTELGPYSIAVGDLVGGYSKRGARYVYWIVREIVGVGQYIVFPWLYDASDLAIMVPTYLVTDDILWLIKGVAIAQQFQPFGPQDGFVSKDFSQLALLLGMNATARQISLVFSSEANPVETTLVSSDTVEITLRSEVPTEASRANRIVVRVEHNRPGEFFNLIGFVHDYDEIESEEAER